MKTENQTNKTKVGQCVILNRFFSFSFDSRSTEAMLILWWSLKTHKIFIIIIISSSSIKKITEKLYKIYILCAFLKTANILQQLYGSICVSRHLQLRTGAFCGREFYCPNALADGN